MTPLLGYHAGRSDDRGLVVKELSRPDLMTVAGCLDAAGLSPSYGDSKSR